MTDKIFNVLFICTGNSARSIMAESLLNKMGKGRFRAFSAGSHPSGVLNPYALQQLADTAHSVNMLRSKGWDEFATPAAPKMDFIITVCDNAAGEVCPVWPGQPISAHWGFQDPALLDGSSDAKRALCQKVFRQIVSRVNIFISLPLHMLEKNAIKHELDKIGSSNLGVI